MKKAGGAYLEKGMRRLLRFLVIIHKKGLRLI